jgi:hypothetical protein
MGFEWRTDDEEGPVPGWREEKRSRRVRRSRWSWYLLLVAAAIAAAVYLWRLANERVEATLEEARADVRVTQALVERAAATADVELLRTTLSGRDEAWTAAQRDLVEEGNGYTAVARLLGLEPAGDPEELSLTLDPRLRSAELVVAQRYDAASMVVSSEPVVLEQTFVFRRGSNRWLLAPPEPEFWGSRHSLQTGNIQFRFPGRDLEVVRQLAVDLAADVRALCDSLPEGCPADLALGVTFDTDPESLLRFDDGRAMLRSGTDLILPTPTLLGLPQDEAGYETLRLAYTHYLLSASLPALTEWECCEQVLFWQALLQARLGELGLAPPLLPQAEALAALELVADRAGFFDTLTRYWPRQTPAAVTASLPLEVRTLVAFLLDWTATGSAENGPMVAEMEAALLDAPSVGRWWSSFTPFASFHEAEIGGLLLAFARERYVPAPLPPGLGLPDADLLLVCRTEGARVWRYDLHAQSWTAEIELPRDEVFALLTHGDSYFVSALRYTADGESPVFRLLEKRPGRPAIEVAAESGAIWVPLVKHGDTIPVVIFRLEEQGSEQPQLALLDLASCRAGGCAWEETPGIVSMAPGGQHELAFSLAGLVGASELFLRERGAEWQRVAEGAFPLWLDSRTFAYLEEERGSGYARVMVQDVEGNSAILFDADEVSGSLLDGRAVGVRQGAVSAATPDRLFLVAQVVTGTQESYVLAVPQPASGSWMVAEPPLPEVWAKNSGTVSYNILPEATAAGRWLVVTLAGTGLRPVPTYWLVDMVGQHAPVSVNGIEEYWLGSSHDWSEDGEWLAWPVPGGVSLMAPAYRDGGAPYRLFIAAEQAGCSMAVWLERN